MAIEKRRTDLFEINIPVTVAQMPNGTQLHISNISTNGLFISTTSPFEVNREIDCSFSVPKSRKTIQVKGRVAWSRNSGANPGMGVEFIDLNEKQFDTILKFLESIY